MNIFLFDFDLTENAKWFKIHDKRRFNKQIIESTQLFAASMKHWYGVEVMKADGYPYIVNRILFHPACKYLLEDITNHEWHVNYLLSLLELFPNHSCNASVKNALALAGCVVQDVIPKTYLKITNSDMTGIPEDAPVTEFYRRHLENKHKGVAA